MEEILIVLIVLLVLVVLILVGITIFGKKKANLTLEKNDIIEESVPELKLEKPEVLKNDSELKLEEPVIELDPLEQTREQTEVIEIISSMQEKAKDLTDKVADYEDEQEENAIISYTELLNAVKAKKEVQEELDFDVKEEVTEKPYDDSKKFHSSEAISPLGRINSVSNDSYKSMTKPTDMQDEDFLKSLKDFRGNL